MAKNIVVLSDGTGQDGGRGHDTNVYKVFRMLEDRTSQQVVFYDQGLGTDWRKVTGSAFGAGFNKNILQCYRFIYDNYEAGDKIFLFGFSRGAATVRSLANFIHYFGILPKARPELIQRAWRLYKAGRSQRIADEKDQKEDSFNDRAQKFVKEHPNHWVQIDFLGVWDTVPALGLVPLATLNTLINNIPWFKHRFHDFKLHKSVLNAYHALAIDDDRLWFHPTVWKECGEKQIVQQVWFSGSHTDVGGGFMAGGLADLSLEWMIEKAIFHGLRIYLGSRRNWNFVIAPDAIDREHPPRAGAGVIYKKGNRNVVWDQHTFDSYGPPKIHASVLDRMREVPGYRPWVVDVNKEFMAQLPMKYEESIRAEYDQGYDTACSEYAEALEKHSVNELPPLPENRKEWAEKNPFDAWLAKKLPSYAEKIAEGVEGVELQEFLEQYQPYKEWLAATYAPFEETEFGNLMVEPYSRLYQYRDRNNHLRFTNEDIDQKTCKDLGYTDKQPLKFRDYDRVTLKELVDGGLDRSERGEYFNLLDRVVLPRPIKAQQSPVYPNVFSAILSGLVGLFKQKNGSQWESRYEYDKERWYSNQTD